MLRHPVHTGVDSRRPLSIYRRREAIGKCFEDHMNHIDMMGLCENAADTAAGKVSFCFTAQILISVIGSRLRPLSRERPWGRKGVTPNG